MVSTRTPTGAPKIRKSHGIWLIAGVITLNMLIVGLVTMSLLDSRERAVRQVRVNAANLADLVRRNLTDYGVRIDAKLQAAIDEIARNGGVELARSQLRDQWLNKFELRLPSGSSLQVVDATGKPVWPRQKHQFQAPDVGNQEFLRRHMTDNTETLQVSPAVKDPQSGQWFVPCSRTLRAADGSFEGMVIAVIPIMFFEKLIAGIDAGPQGILLLRDIERGLIAFSRPITGPAARIGSRNITSQATLLLDSGVERASYEAPMSPDGVPRTYAFHWSRPMSMVVGVGMAPQDYLTAWDRQVMSSGLLVLAFLIISAGGTWVIQRAWVRLGNDMTIMRKHEDELGRQKQELQDLARSTLQVREEERKILARELHDDLGHRVTAISMDLGKLESKLLPSESEANAMLPVILGHVYQFADATRRICEELRPGMLDALGFPAAVEDQVNRFAARSGISCELVMSHGDFPVDANVGINLFRILQEALNNTLKYANASKVMVTLRLAENEISLIVEDDGVGLPEQGTETRIGFGLLGMRERVAILNGKLSIFSEPGRGVRIEVVVPA